MIQRLRTLWYVNILLFMKGEYTIVRFDIHIRGTLTRLNCYDALTIINRPSSTVRVSYII